MRYQRAFIVTRIGNRTKYLDTVFCNAGTINTPYQFFSLARKHRPADHFNTAPYLVLSLKILFGVQTFLIYCEGLISEFYATFEKHFPNITAMKQTEVFKKIGVIIKELNEQYEYLQTTADNLNDLELELFVANTHFLKDHAEILRKLNLIKSQQLALPEHTDARLAEEQKPVAQEPRYFEPVVQQVKPIAASTPFQAEPVPEPKEDIKFEIAPSDNPAPQIDLRSGSRGDDYSYTREDESGTIRHELILNEADTWDEDEPAAEEIKPEKELQIPPVPLPLAEEPAKPVELQPTAPPAAPLLNIYADEPKEEHVLTLNERISAQLKEKNGPAPTQTAQPIADIKAAISLNDKLLFVKDLFNGYNLAYSEAIEIVNRFTSFEEADRFLKNNYVTKNNWADKKATADKFYALLKRRYA